MKIIESELSYNFTYKDILDIIKIIDDASCHEVHIELEDLKLKIIKGNPHVPAPAPAAAVVPPVQVVSELRNTTAAGQPSIKSKHKTGIKTAHSQAAPNKKKETVGEEHINGVPILSPLAGTFYCAPEPGAKPFVEIGVRVEKGQQVGIVEVMKLMTNIKAPVNGVIKEIRVKNEETVGMGQILMTMDPS